MELKVPREFLISSIKLRLASNAGGGIDGGGGGAFGGGGGGGGGGGAADVGTLEDVDGGNGALPLDEGGTGAGPREAIDTCRRGDCM